MATNYTEVLIGGLNAGADLSAKQGYCVMIEADGDANVATAATGFRGILLNEPESGEPCAIAGPGSEVAALAGGTFAPGDVLKVDTGDGMLVIATDGDIVVAEAQTAGTDGTWARVLVRHAAAEADVSAIGVANAS